jgi:hypothetical protein
MVRLSGCIGHHQRREQPLDLAIDVQAAPAGGDHRHLRTRTKDAGDRMGHHPRQVLTVVHDQQGRAGAQMVGDALQRVHPRPGLHADGSSDHRVHGPLVRNGRQVDHPPAIPVATNESLGQLDGEAGLSHSRRSGDGEQASAGQPLQDLDDLVLSTHQAPQRGRERRRFGSVVAVTPELVSEDLLLHGTHLWAGDDAELPPQLPLERSVDGKCVRRASRPIQHGHEHAGQSLVERVRRHRLLNRGDHLRRPVDRHRCLGQADEAVPSQRVQRRPFGIRPGTLEPLENRAPPLCPRPPERLVHLRNRGRRTRRAHQRLDLGDVGPQGCHLGDVTAVRTGDRDRLTEAPAEVGDVGAQ